MLAHLHKHLGRESIGHRTAAVARSRAALRVGKASVAQTATRTVEGGAVKVPRLATLQGEFLIMNARDRFSDEETRHRAANSLGTDGEQVLAPWSQLPKLPPAGAIPQTRVDSECYRTVARIMKAEFTERHA
jgi:hypothetical protein